MRHCHVIQLTLAGVALFVPAAHAATHCVGTAAALQTALTTAAASSENNTIKVQAGTYFAPVNGFTYHRNSGAFSLDIEGGWNAACSVQTHDAALTILDGQSQTRIMDVSDVTGTSVTIRFLNMLHSMSALSALSIAEQGDVHVDNCRFRLNVVSGPGGGEYVTYIQTANGSIYYTNNIVANNTATGQQSVVGFGTTGPGVNVYVNNNTIADNAFANGTQSSGAVFLQPDMQGSFANNILWGNGGNEFEQVVTIHPVLLNNDVDVLNITPGAGSSGNIGGNPRFVSATNHHVQSGTPTYNAGFTAPPGGYGVFDLDGNPRVALGAVDIGAYELQTEPDDIFLDGFEGG